VGDAIRYGDGANYDLDSFIVMPNHVHAIVQFRPGAGWKLSVKSWMRFTARRINEKTGQSGPFWQPEPFDHIIRGDEEFCYLHDYIANNPINPNLDPANCLYYRI
jgi:REP element-mobilizing transposase RayT